MLERSFLRLERALRSEVPALQPLLMRDDGSLWLDGERCAPDAAAPVVAWANSEVYDGGPTRDFMVFCLKSPSLKLIQSSAAGFDHPVFGMLVDKGIALANSDASAIAIAEFVMASVLDLWNEGARRRSAQAEGRWEPSRFRELHGTHWLVIGMGNIGSEVALRARAFGASVSGVRRTPTGREPADRMLTPAALQQAIPQADVVVLCAPATPQTQQLVNADFLRGMRPRSVLVNVARGALVDEGALLEALERGVPEYAVLDVFAQEPLPAQSPFWSHPRVRVSAHTAAASDGFTRRSDRLFLDNLARFARGETPLRVVPAEVVKQSQHG